jgi:probable rRNA maturation factor
MLMAKVNFFTESVDFKLPHPRKTSTWICASILSEKKKLKELNYIFCSDEHLREMNIQFLNHKTFTDILTFDNSEDGSIEGDIFISIDRVKENSAKFNTDFLTELHRVIIHGALHLIGYKDKSDRDKKAMRKKEDAYLSLRK